MTPLRRPAHAAVLVAAGLLAAGGCTDQGGVNGIVGGPLPTGATVPSAIANAPTSPTSPTSSPPTTAPATTGAGPSPDPSTSGPATTAVPSRLRLGGNDLGVTRVGAPMREAVAAITAELGPPTGDPAPDTSCIGAEEETSWGSFRLGGSGGRVSGWLSTSTSLATPAGVTVGTELIDVRLAYGPRLQVRPPAPDSGTIFVVDGAGLAGTLTGPAPFDTVTSLFNGTCEAA